MRPKSNLRWPGGKSRAINQIPDHVPSSVTVVASPFLGGGSVELAMCVRAFVWAYDNCSYTINYWRMLQRCPDRIADRMERIFLPKMIEMGDRFFYRLQAGIHLIDDPYDRAASFFTLNRASFSGTTLAGGMSSGFPRLTPSIISNLRRFSSKNLTVDCQDFKVSIPANAKRFLFLDPPYFLAKGKNNLYGRKGAAHKIVNHVDLFKLLSRRPNGDFVLCYNDCDFIRTLYKDYRQIPLGWTYGMNNNKAKSSEILIVA